MGNFQRLVLTFLILGYTSACSRPHQRAAVPEHWAERVKPLCFDDVRYFTQVGSGACHYSFPEKELQSQKDLITIDEKGQGAFSVLALSGGGSDGAFAGGFLQGWSQSGTRPVFTVVTGVSIGAMIAPFAFLGENYDHVLENFYTHSSAVDVYRERGLIASFFSDSLYTVEPLKALINCHITCELLEEIAQEHRRGRRLYVSTTDLDTQRLVIWDMGKIATAGTQAGLELFKQVLLASTAIPVYFPPVYIPVHTNERHFEEIHVDGGAITHVFFPCRALDHLKASFTEAKTQPSGSGVKLYVIVNGAYHWNSIEVEDKILPIAARSIETVATYQSLCDVWRLYHLSQEKNIDFYLTYIPSSYSTKRSGIFDKEDMQHLFRLGHKQGLKDHGWADSPPIFRP